MERVLQLELCDYRNNPICTLYDSKSNVTGQAYDVFINYERNGWKELTFSIPSTIETENGTEPNYRIDYLVADFRIKATDNKETDWYLVSEPKITHNRFARSVDVRAGHISQILKTKALELEFSDQEGNNVGTAEELLTTILEGTGWTVGTVDQFLEEDKTIKKRTLNASAKTGALGLINSLCELFDAKAVYHGDGKTVDLLHLNPFSEDYTEGTPAEVNLDNAFELHYSKNMKSVTRTLNTENMVTRLYAQGSYGDVATGICNIQTCTHFEYTFSGVEAGREHSFVDNTGSTFYFYVPAEKEISGKVVWSKLDIFSRSYVYDTEKKLFFEVTKTKQTDTAPKTLSATPVEVTNYVPFIMNFDYYRKIGLMTDEQFLELVKYQRDLPGLYKTSQNASKESIDAISKFSEIAEPRTGFLKMKVKSVSKSENHLLLTLDASVGDNGVIYRNDYDEAKKNYFTWYVAGELKENGDPVSMLGSIVFIIHADNTWHTAYLEKIYNDKGPIVDEDGKPTHYYYSLTPGSDPTSVMLHLNYDDVVGSINLNTDRFYLFCANSMSGMLGVNMASDEAVLQTIEDTTKVETVRHPVFFSPIDDNALVSQIPDNEYGWLYQCNINARKGSQSSSTSVLYFCNKQSKETSWHRVFTDETEPDFIRNVHAGNYFFNLKNKTLHLGGASGWLQMTTKADERLARTFSSVLMLCNQRERLYTGWYNSYVRQASKMKAGNYAAKLGYDTFLLFSTDREINNTITLDTVNGLVYQIPNDTQSVVSYKARSYDAVDFPQDSVVSAVTYNNGNISNTGVDISNADYYRTGYIRVYAGTEYTYRVPGNASVYFYDQNKTFLMKQSLTATSAQKQTYTFEAPSASEIPPDVSQITNYKAGAYYMRLAVKTTSVASFLNKTYYIQITDYSSKLISGDKLYTILTDFTPSPDAERMGINYLMPKFASLADTAYFEKLNILLKAQQAIKDRNLSIIDAIGDMLRDGYWQDENYVEGDEERLYKDAMDNLKEISKPETTYDIEFLDLYGANKNIDYSLSAETGVSWPDIQVTDAVHLIDEDLDTNCWAYVDRLNKCFDQPWKTTLEINTKMSLIDQHDFTDVMAHIAQVAKETKAKQGIYKRAASLTGSGQLAANKLQGTISAYVNQITGGASSWYTDEKGNIVFVSADGQSAMTLSGNGLCIADSKDKNGDWNWRTAATGSGVVADSITTGTLSAVLIEAGAITADKLSASVGNELEISSNQALTLFATADGSRPAGSLLTGKVTTDADGNTTTSKVGEDESYIQIAPKQGTSEAHIDIMSGGNINMEAGSVLTLKGSIMSLNGTSEMNIASGGTVKIETGNTGKFIVDSPNFKISEKDNSVTVVGKITTTGGNIAGFTIGKSNNRNYMYAGSITSVSDTGPGVYIGTDGINVGNGALKINADGSTRQINMPAESVILGNTTLSSILSGMNKNITDANTAASSAKTKADEKARTYVCTKAEILKETGFVEGDIWKDSGSDYGYQYVCTKKYDKATNYVEENINKYWALVGTSITGGSALSINAASGKIDMVAANTINVAAGATISISANQKLSLTTQGTIEIGNGGAPFTIGANNKRAYIYNGVTEMSDVAHDGVYVGTDGIALGKGVFTVTKTGVLTATSATIEGKITAKKGSIGGWTIGSTYLGDGATLATSTIGIRKGTDDKDIVFFAGANGSTTSSAKFKVTKAGYLTATSGEIGGWVLGTNYLGDNSDLKTSTIGIRKGTSDSHIVFFAGADGKDIATAKFRVTKAGALTAESGTIGGWSINDKYIYSGSKTTTVKLDGSETQYSLPWYNSKTGTTTNTDHMFAMWCGNADATKAPFSVTKDGVVTIKKLRVDVGTDENHPRYVKVDFEKWLGPDSGTDDDGEQWKVPVSQLMGKLKFQTIKSITVGKDGRVIVRLTDDKGGTQSVGFNTASSAYLDFSWTGGRNHYTGRGEGVLSIYVKIPGKTLQTVNVYLNEDPDGKCVDVNWRGSDGVSVHKAVPTVKTYEKGRDEAGA